EKSGIQLVAADSPEIFATVPGVIAFYLGARPSEPELYQFVKPVPENPPDGKSQADCWLILEARLISGAYGKWLRDNCVLHGTFAAKTGPIDRSVLVYEFQNRNRK